MAGKLQDADFKTAAELISGGATVSSHLNDPRIYISALSINKTLYQAIVDGDISGSEANKETLTLSAADITNGYKALAFEALANSVDLHVDRVKMFQTRDYTLSIVSLVTRITFVNSFIVGGDNELVEGDILYVEYFKA